MDIRTRFGLRIRNLRNQLDWSQEELAAQAGMHRTYISAIERGARNPTLTVIERLAAALDVNLGELLSNL